MLVFAMAATNGRVPAPIQTSPWPCGFAQNGGLCPATMIYVNNPWPRNIIGCARNLWPRGFGRVGKKFQAGKKTTTQLVALT